MAAANSSSTTTQGSLTTTQGSLTSATPPPTDHALFELATPLEDDEDHLDSFYDGNPLWYRMVSSIIGVGTPLEETPRLFA